MAQFLNDLFFGFDKAILQFYHTLLTIMGDFLTPVMKFITFIGEKGAIVLLVALVLMLFSKTRKTGVAMFGAVCCGAIFTNIILKDLIARPRPFETVELFHEWWLAAGAPAENGFSFPSGHVTAMMSSMTALVLSGNKKYVYFALPSVILMAASRNYLMAHYPSDALAAMIVGLIAGIIAHLIANAIWNFIKNKKNLKLFDFILNFDIIKHKKV